MMESYFTNNKKLKLVLWLLDSRRELSKEDLEFVEFLSQIEVKVLVCFTKVDKLNQSEKAKITKIARTELANFDFVFTSQFNPKLIEELRNQIAVRL